MPAKQMSNAAVGLEAWKGTALSDRQATRR